MTTQTQTDQTLSSDNQIELEKISAIKSEMSKVIVGQTNLIDRMLIALFCNGHMLLEGVPGLAKTTAIATLAKTLDVDFKRIQFTPDLLPSDLIGSLIYNQQSGDFHIKKGPVFTNFVLADEINRAPAKVQSALLEAMQERQVTIGDKTHRLPRPFFVMATQNPIEQEGTYALPEAQIDRFLFKTLVVYPTHDEELIIMDRPVSQKNTPVTAVANKTDLESIRKKIQTVYLDESIKTYIVNLVRATREPLTCVTEEQASLFSFGASPRASIGLVKASRAVAFMNNRNYVIPEDVKEIAPDILRHRVIPTYEAEAQNVSQDELVQIITEHIPVP